MYTEWGEVPDLPPLESNDDKWQLTNPWALRELRKPPSDEMIGMLLEGISVESIVSDLRGVNIIKPHETTVNDFQNPEELVEGRVVNL